MHREQEPSNFVCEFSLSLVSCLLEFSPASPSFKAKTLSPDHDHYQTQAMNIVMPILTPYHLRTHDIPHPLIMNTPRYLSIKEAAVSSGKSEITIRRLVRKVVTEKNAKQRILIQPSTKDVATLKSKNQPFAWTLSEELLRDAFTAGTTAQAAAKGSDQATTSETDHDHAHDHSHDEDHEHGQQEIITLLKQELASKDDQLKVKDHQISSLTTLVHSLGDQLNERLREGNLLMKGLQDRMALPAPAQETAKRMGLFKRLMSH